MNKESIEGTVTSKAFANCKRVLNKEFSEKHLLGVGKLQNKEFRFVANRCRSKSSELVPNKKFGKSHERLVKFFISPDLLVEQRVHVRDQLVLIVDRRAWGWCQEV